MRTGDSLDNKLLNILGINCRISYAAIGRALRLSKDAIAYRVRHLEESGAIARYMLLIDARMLGFTRYHLLLRLEGGSTEQRRAIAKLATHPYVMWINTFAGRYDAQLIVDARDSLHLNLIRKELFSLCDNRVRHYSVLTHLYDLEFTNLFPEIDRQVTFEKGEDSSFASYAAKRSYPVPEKFSLYPYNRLELDILRVLAEDPRTTVSDLATAVRSSRITVRRRVIDLLKAGVIRSMGAIANSQAFGYVTYYLLVRVSQASSAQVLKAPFRKLSNVFYAGAMLGDYDMILYLYAKTPAELNASIDHFRVALEPHLQHYDLLVQEGVHHWRHFTPGIFRDCSELLTRGNQTGPGEK